MKKIIAVLALALASTNSFAVTVANGKIVRNASGDEAISVDVAYGGGCKAHKFSLEIGMCLERMPVDCDATIVDATKDDFCEAYIHETIELPLKQNGLLTSYYSGATITINGDNKTKTEVTLPRF